MRKELSYLVPIGIGIVASAMINKKMRKKSMGMMKHSRMMMKSFM